jgi:hypothetical protein
MIGYTPHRKVYTIKAHWDAYDLGVIKMEENAEFLEASTVSAIGNPIVVKKDTIEFNAASFNVSENAMLEDLIKKMPGMEVAEDGTVTLNGEKIDKITVGGKTFFFNDPTAALKNLPAKIVEKIKVIDRTKDEAGGSGIVTEDDKEKVMDVELKDEYTEGWYGNAKLGAGSTLTPDTGNSLIDERGLLYNGNAMQSIIVEVILTCIFVLAVLGATSKAENSHVAGLVIGGALTLVHLIGIYFTGTSVNPARSFGPALILGGANLSVVWVFIVGPMIGGIIAAVIWKILWSGEN